MHRTRELLDDLRAARMLTWDAIESHRPHEDCVELLRQETEVVYALKDGLAEHRRLAHHLRDHHGDHLLGSPWFMHVIRSPRHGLARIVNLRARHSDPRRQRMQVRREAESAYMRSTPCADLRDPCHRTMLDFLVEHGMDLDAEVARMSDDIHAAMYRALTTSDGVKIPYTDAGIAIISNSIKSVFESRDYKNVTVWGPSPLMALAGDYVVQVMATAPGTIEQITITGSVGF